MSILELQATKQLMSDTNGSAQHGLKNNVADFAETSEFKGKKLALSWSMLRSPTHQLLVHMRICTLCM